MLQVTVKRYSLARRIHNRLPISIIIVLLSLRALSKKPRLSTKMEALVAKLTDREIEDKYDNEGLNLNQERSDFLLPQVMDFIRGKKWINLQPEYQRRLVWDNKQRSLFVESLLMNLPVPPVFLFEIEYSRYEVIDGQQRLSTISAFYENRLKLSGLEKWPELNGRNYSDLPPMIQRGLDRRRISAVVVLAEGVKEKKTKDDVRRMMFERLNTGGQNLNAQELRNCFYSGPFNAAIIKLAGNSLFNDIWEIPRYEDNIRGDHISAELSSNVLFKRMGDCEIVLRFFALRKKANIKGSVRAMLDRCMEDNLNASPEEIQEMMTSFLDCLKLANEIFKEHCFRLPNGAAYGKPSAPLFDGIMVALDRQYINSDKILKKRTSVVKKLNEMLGDPDFYELVVSRANTADSIKKRIDEIEKLFLGVIND